MDSEELLRAGSLWLWRRRRWSAIREGGREEEVAEATGQQGGRVFCVSAALAFYPTLSCSSERLDSLLPRAAAKVSLDSQARR